GLFDSRVVEPGPPPILTERGIVLVYNGADDQLVYRAAVAVFDRRDPRRLLSRSDAPLFAPEKPWEKVGQVPNVVFVEGMVLAKGKDEGTVLAPGKDEGMAHNANRWLFYYGAADKFIGAAAAVAEALQFQRSSLPLTHSPLSFFLSQSYPTPTC